MALTAFGKTLSPPDTEEFPRLAEQILRLYVLRLRLKHNFDRFNSTFTRRRKW